MEQHRSKPNLKDRIIELERQMKLLLEQQMPDFERRIAELEMSRKQKPVSKDESSVKTSKTEIQPKTKIPTQKIDNVTFYFSSSVESMMNSLITALKYDTRIKFNNHLKILVKFASHSRVDYTSEERSLNFDAGIVFYIGQNPVNIELLKSFSFKLGDTFQQIDKRDHLTQDAISALRKYLTESSQVKSSICHVCNVDMADKVCSMCNVTRYCSIECQACDWSEHGCSK